MLEKIITIIIITIKSNLSHEKRSEYKTSIDGEVLSKYYQREILTSATDTVPKCDLLINCVTIILSDPQESTSYMPAPIEFFILSMKPRAIIYYAISLILEPACCTYSSGQKHPPSEDRQLLQQVQDCFKFAKFTCHENSTISEKC